MGKHDISRSIPATMQPQFHARNRDIPMASVWAKIASGYNQCFGRQRKLILCKSQHLGFLSSAAPGQVGFGWAWPFYFRTGDATRGIEVHLGLAASDDPDTAAIPLVEIRLERASGGQTFTKAINYQARDEGITIGGGNIARKTMIFTGLADNTEYHGIFRFVNGARIVYATVNEMTRGIADDVAFAQHCNPTQFVNTGDIERAHQVDLRVAALALWRHNAAHLFSFTANYRLTDFDEMPDVTSTDYAPLMPAGVPGFHLNMSNRGTLQRRNAVPCRMAVYVIPFGPAGDVRFRLRGEGGFEAAFTAAVDPANPGWVVGDVVMPALTNTQWHMEADTNGRRIVFGGWSLFQWEA